MLSEDRLIEVKVSLEDPGERLVVVPNIPHRIIIQRGSMVIDVIEAEDVLFRYKSTVMLPDRIPESELDETKQPVADDLFTPKIEKQIAVSGLSVIKGILRYANLCNKRKEPKKLLIAGHTDSKGSDGYNADLSLMRAKMVLAVIIGDKDSRDYFATTADDMHAPEDQQHILQWISTTYGYPEIDPIFIDGEYGWRTTNAILAFKRILKDDNLFPPKKFKHVPWPGDMADLRDALKTGSHIGAGSWRVIFELYQAEIRRSLMEDNLNIDEIRESLQWVDEEKKAVGCGETWPIVARGVDNYKSQENRRVEILFYDPIELRKELPCKDSECAQGDCHIYKDMDRYNEKKPTLEPRFRWKYLLLTKEGRLRRSSVFKFSI